MPNTSILKANYFNLLSSYEKEETKMENYWIEIVQHYSSTQRYYHNCEHLQTMLLAFIEIKSQLKNQDAFLFALFYHDIIYDTNEINNEEQSALFAKNILEELHVPEEIIIQTQELIIATKSHSSFLNKDIILFLDTDLIVLGKSESEYNMYTKQIRQEYAQYADVEFNAGRKKVLQHFLAMDRIFKSDYFYNKYENQARRNLLGEFQLL